MAVGYPSGTNTYVPNHAASQSLIVGYSRSPNKFKVGQYAQYVRARNNVGLYMVWASRQAARIQTSTDREHSWSDGEAAPVGANNLEGWEWKQFNTQRYAYPFTMGEMAVEQATFPILAAMSGVCAQQAMTARTLLSYTALSGASWGNNTAAVVGGILPAANGWNNGSAGLSTSTYTMPGPNIKVSLQYAAKIINIATIGVVDPTMLTLVINPTTAMAMASSPEIQNYVSQSPFALAQLRGDVPNQNGVWGLPTMLYGYNVVVEDAVRVSTPKGRSPETINYVLPDDEAYLLARDGELTGIEGSRSYSTVQIFFFNDEMTVFSKYDSDNLRYMGRVVQNYQPLVVTTFSGFRFTDVIY